VSAVPGYVNDDQICYGTVPSPPYQSSPPSYSSPPCKVEDLPPYPPIQTITTPSLKKFVIAEAPPPTESVRQPQPEPLTVSQTSTPLHLNTSSYYQPKYEQQQTLSESGGGHQTTDTGTVKTDRFPGAEIPQTQTTTSKGNKRQASTSIDSRPSKRGVPHDRTPVENFLDQARTLNNFEVTGLKDCGKFVVIHEDNFFDWIMKKKDPKFRILKKTSFYEKFDKSRPANRVDSKQKTGPFAIKYLRVDKYKNTEYHDLVKKDMEEIERKYGVPNMRVITHRDWKYIHTKFFVYEGKK